MTDYRKALSGLSSFLGSMSDGTMRARRGEAMNTNVKGHTVDTCVPGDTGKWETGIKRNGVWIIVEQYENDKEATKGHSKWVNKIKENPDCKLNGIDMWGLNE